MSVAKNTIIHNFTEGPLLKQLTLFALPFMASNAMQLLYSVVDMAVVGHYVGKQGLAAVALSSKLFMFMTMVCSGLSQGGQVYLSQLIGSGERQRLNQAIGTLFTVLFSFGAVVTVAGLLFAKQFLRLLNTPPDAFDQALSYTLVCAAGTLFSYGYNITSAVFRGLGDSRHPFYFILIASIINLVLDFLFVAGFKWGVFGAGLATILGQAFSFIYAQWFLMRHRSETGIEISRKTLKIDTKCLKGLLMLGAPLAIRFSIINFSMLFVMSMVASLGTTELSTYGAGLQLDDIANKMSLGIMMALTTIIAQNYGARNFTRIRKAIVYTLLLSLGFYAIVASALWFFPKAMFGIFTSDPDVMNLCPVFVHAIIWTFPALLLMKGTNGFIMGIGNTRLAMFLGLFDGCILRIGFTWLLGSFFNLGFYGYVLGYGISPWGTVIPGFLYMFFAPWEKRKLATE
ncbi:MAG: MATE family efflux transporter [Lentisphaeria bacterium]|nr:MATE family efflux transporter [Lentisphaeria bacterium]